MSMALLASEFGYLDLTRKSILFLTSSPRGASAIRVAVAPAAAAPSTPMPLVGWLARDGGIGGYPVIIRGLVVTGECPSHGGVRGKTRSRTTPCQSASNREAPRHIILLG